MTNVYDLAAGLPPIEVLRQRVRALAVLDRILGGDFPYYAYTGWGQDEAGLMSDGSGNEWAIVFTTDGVFIRVFDHESPMSPYRDADHELWPGLLDGLPAVFGTQLEEPAFADEEGGFLATAVLWRLGTDDRWHAGTGIDFPGPDGSELLAILLDDIADRYVAFAEDYYETAVDRAAVAHVVAHRPLTEAVVRYLDARAEPSAGGVPRRDGRRGQL